LTLLRALSKPKTGQSTLLPPASAVGELAPFRPGIGLLVKQAHAPVLPVALIGLGELKAKGRGWFRSGKIEVRVGRPLRFGALLTEAEITEQLHSAVAALMSSNR